MRSPHDTATSAMTSPPVTLLALELDEPLDQVFVGGRVYVRFDHGTEPLATRWYRGLRRLFLKRFNV